MKRITALDVANYFINLSAKYNREISNKKVQKLIYYAQAWTLALTGKALFSEKIEAWIHGPAIPDIYKKFKKYGFCPIKGEKINLDPSVFSSTEILDEVWRVYGKYDADYLELLTHQEDPWVNARNQLEFTDSSNIVISEHSMQAFYSQKLK